MSTAIAIFVKTPSLSPVKTRLAATIGTDKAQAFYKLSLQSVQEITQSAAIVPYWAVAEENGLTDPLWQDCTPIWTGDGNLGERQHRVYETLLQKHEHVMLIGADTPQISRSILNAAVDLLASHDFVIGPARDGGYYLFGGRVSTQQIVWTSVPWSTDLTRVRLEAGLPSAPAHLPMLTDVDNQEDLQFVLQEMPVNRSLKQQQLVEWIFINERPASLRG